MAHHLEGTWYNQYGSHMRLIVAADGRLTGSFHTAAGRAGPAREFAVTGFVANELISFTVNFGEFGSLTSWVGHHVHVDSGDTLEALWQMAVRVPHPDRAHDLWKSVWSGADSFQRTAPRVKNGHRMPPHPLWLAD